jgi:uncharacterized membrane protein
LGDGHENSAERAEPGRSRRAPATGLCLLALALAAAWRLVRLGLPPLWLDEGYSAQIAQAGSLKVWMQDAHPPLYHAFLSGWSRLWGSDFGLRFPSALFGVAAVGVVFLIGRRAFGRRPAVWSALLLACFGVHVWHSQEVRMYALVVLLFAGALWGALAVAEEGGAWRGWAAYVACSALMCYTQAVALLYWAVLAAVLLWLLLVRGQWARLKWRYVGANAVVALLFVPWVPVMAARAAGMAQSDTYYIARPSALEPLGLLFYYFAFGWVPPVRRVLSERLGVPGGLVPGNWALAVPVVLLLLAGAAFCPRRLRANLAAMWLGVFLCAGALYAVSVAVLPILVQKTLLPAVVPLSLALGAAACARGRRRPVASVLLALVLVQLCAGTYFYQRYRGFREGWDRASAHLQREAREGDLALVFSSFALAETGAYLVRRYDPHGVLADLRLEDPGPFLTREGRLRPGAWDELAAMLAGSRAVWVVERKALREVLLREVLSERLALLETREFEGIFVSRFSLPPPGEQATSASAVQTR